MPPGGAGQGVAQLTVLRWAWGRHPLACLFAARAPYTHHPWAHRRFWRGDFAQWPGHCCQRSRITHEDFDPFYRCCGSPGHGSPAGPTTCTSQAPGERQIGAACPHHHGDDQSRCASRRTCCSARCNLCRSCSCHARHCRRRSTCRRTGCPLGNDGHHGRRCRRCRGRWHGGQCPGQRHRAV